MTSFTWLNSYALFLLFKCSCPPIFINIPHHFPLQLRTINLFCGIKGLLPHFYAGRIFIYFSYGLSRSNTCHYGFPNLNKLHSTLISSFSFVFHTHYVYAFQILLVRLLKLFVMFWMFLIPTYTCFFWLS